MDRVRGFLRRGLGVVEGHLSSCHFGFESRSGDLLERGRGNSEAIATGSLQISSSIVPVVPIDTTASWIEPNAARSEKIQIPFVKLMCYVAWRTRHSLTSKVTFGSPVIVAHQENTDEFHSSCIVCPKLDRLTPTSDFESGVQKARIHTMSFHQRPKTNLRRLSLGSKANSEFKLTVKQYLTKLQENIAATDRALAFLDLKDEDYWNRTEEKKAF